MRAYSIALALFAFGFIVGALNGLAIAHTQLVAPTIEAHVPNPNMRVFHAIEQLGDEPTRRVLGPLEPIGDVLELSKPLGHHHERPALGPREQLDQIAASALELATGAGNDPNAHHRDNLLGDLHVGHEAIGYRGLFAQLDDAPIQAAVGHGAHHAKGCGR